VVVVEFLKLSFFFEKHFLDHRAPLKFGADLQHCPVMLNIFLNDKTLQQKPPKATLRLTLALDQTLFAYFV